MAKIDKKGRMIAIADFLFANPSKERADILAKFGKKWQMSVRTVDRIIKEAKQYNSSRIDKQEKIKDGVISDNAKELITEGIISRNESLKILSDIAKGVGRPTNPDVDDNPKSNEKIIPADGDRIRAIQQIAKMEGWEATKKIDINQFFEPFDTGTGE